MSVIHKTEVFLEMNNLKHSKKVYMPIFFFQRYKKIPWLLVSLQKGKRKISIHYEIKAL